ncbi:GAF domain-containing protein [Waterburya agarophytonicola K14]|uniref:GAF domain-containing protein n=1 Tax=Waterburya agarophytonicola KI4 TaxID=2874699 RepID=A0A964BTE9_9CYAN|nr:GAF domain-containing protein [Waterburya agarophytonicola]MCC0179160.1 GAF domain-containing protein [Waterburya agarophytonicola KI4]
MSDPGLEKLLHRLSNNLSEDKLVQNVTNNVRKQIGVDRVLLYYFYRQWEGRVTFESLSYVNYSILGSTGPDECFNIEYAKLYLNGRVSAIANIDTAPIAECHRDFLKTIGVQANLVVPILTSAGLWGLLVAHHCQSSFDWLPKHIEIMKTGAKKLAEAKTIQE